MHVDKIQALIEIGNELDIKLRKAPGEDERYPWVIARYNKITFAPPEGISGLYEMHFESYDANSQLQSTLKNDTIWAAVGGPKDLEITFDFEDDADLSGVSYRPIIHWFIQTHHFDPTINRINECRRRQKRYLLDPNECGEF